MMVAKAAKKRDLRVVAIAHVDETDPLLSDEVDEITWVKLGQFGHLIKALKKFGASRTIMAGSITKRKMFDGLKPDLRELALMSKLAIFHDDDILVAVAKELAKEGIDIINCVSYLPELLAPEGCFTRKSPSRSERQDIDLGWKIAKELGRLDIGQCVVLRDKTILALEAIDGTDETILRGGRLAREKAVVVKVSKPDQDMRFDIPTVGLRTIELMSQVKVAVLAIEAGKTLMFDRDEMIKSANKAGISIIAIAGSVQETE